MQMEKWDYNWINKTSALINISYGVYCSITLLLWGVISINIEGVLHKYSIRIYGFFVTAFLFRISGGNKSQRSATVFPQSHEANGAYILRLVRLACISFFPILPCPDINMPKRHE